MKLLAVFLLALALAMSGAEAGKRNAKPAVRDVNRPARWVNVTVDTNRFDNDHPSDPHLAEVADIYTFCLPIEYRPYGEKYVATMTFFLDGPADLLAVDFAFSPEPVDFIHKDPISDGKVTIELHNYDGENFYGWDGKMNSLIAGTVYAKGAGVPRVKFGGLAIWVDASDGLTCDSFMHADEPTMVEEPAEDEPNGGLDPNFPINVEISYIGYGFSPKALRICMFLFAGFIASMVFICCCCHINTHMEEYDELSRMEEQLQMTDIAYAHPVADDDEAVIRRVQEESLREYNMRQQQAPQYHPEQQQYMRVPVMSPELYAQYLRAAQTQQAQM